MSRRRTRLHLAPLAVGSDGALLLGIPWLSDSDDLDEVVRRALRLNAALFVGVVVEGEARVALRKEIDDLACDASMTVASIMQEGRERTGARKRSETKTASGITRRRR